MTWWNLEVDRVDTTSLGMQFRGMKAGDERSALQLRAERRCEYAGRIWVEKGGDRGTKPYSSTSTGRHESTADRQKGRKSTESDGHRWIGDVASREGGNPDHMLIYFFSTKYHGNLVSDRCAQSACVMGKVLLLPMNLFFSHKSLAGCITNFKPGDSFSIKVGIGGLILLVDGL